MTKSGQKRKWPLGIFIFIKKYPMRVKHIYIIYIFISYTYHIYIYIYIFRGEAFLKNCKKLRLKVGGFFKSCFVRHLNVGSGMP